MFEKEAKENKPPYACCTFNTGCELWKDGFQKGAEFGYNKANEWHKVADGDLPKDDIKLAIIEIDDCGYLLCNYRNGFWYDANSGATCAEWITNNIVAWKEIPKYTEENEQCTNKTE